MWRVDSAGGSRRHVPPQARSAGPGAEGFLNNRRRAHQQKQAYRLRRGQVCQPRSNSNAMRAVRPHRLLTFLPEPVHAPAPP